MGPKSVKDGDSPSASVSILPQLRASRRASFASFSNSSQVDKETLSQALDEIHTTASRSETLTAFNEYTTPPPSSSGPDSKGIAGDLQGGLAGLYTRFRASVGNVRDIVNIGGDNAVGEASAEAKLGRSTQSLTPSSRTGTESSRAGSSSANNLARIQAERSERQSPVGTRFADPFRDEEDGEVRLSKNSITGANTSTKSLVGSLTTLKSPPTSITHAPLPTTLTPALASVNVSANQQSESRVSQQNSSRDGEIDIARIASQDVGSNRVQDGNAMIAVANSPRLEPTVRGIINKSGESEGDVALLHADIESGSRQRLSSQISEETVQPFPSVEIEDFDETAIASSSDGDGGRKAPLGVSTSYVNDEDDVFRTTGRQPERSQSDNIKKYQHLEIPLRKGLAPPIVTKSQARISAISPASSSGSNAGSFINASPDQQPLDQRSRSDDLPPTDSAITRKVNLPGQSPHPLRGGPQIKGKALSKQFWMKDENAKDCFHCGDPFSTFRRKHHCRLCGQIFDAKCTSVISGQYLKGSGSIRVCKICESKANIDGDSSEFSDDDTLSVRGFRPRHGSTGANDMLATPVSGSSPSKPRTIHRSSKYANPNVPTMSIPVTRKAAAESSRKPTVLEIDAEQTLTRPTSSRSLKSSFAKKQYHSAHRRHNSRYFIQRGFKSINEDSAPFHRDYPNEKKASRPLPAFHDDNIIDPDLAPYLSDEASSGDEQMSIMAALHGDELSRSHDSDRHGFNGLLTSSRKIRARGGDKTLGAAALASRDADNQSLTNLRTSNVARPSKRRNLSVAGNMHLRPSPRGYRASTTVPNAYDSLNETASSSALTQTTLSNSPPSGSRLIRSSSMRGAAAPAIELNHASLRHVRKLLYQLLEDSKVNNVNGWEKALVPILLRATDDVNPDVRNGDDIDIRHYVKLKKIPGGRPGDTSYVSGLVFTKNLALKCMPRSIPHPNILILTFPLEYSRHHSHYMSLEPVIRQEREYLQNIVDRIAALRPQLLLVERNVSGMALEFLQESNIATTYNVKASVLEAVSRCCQTKIISSIDKLAIKPAQAGKCANFYLKTYPNAGKRKTYMFLSGCAKELGCTIVLRGDSEATLAKVKRITEFMIYVVYNLKLETCVMRDEFVAIPSTTELGTLSSAKDTLHRPFQGLLLDHHQGEKTHANDEAQKGGTSADLENKSSTNNAGSQPSPTSQAEKTKPNLPDEESVPDDVPMPTFYGDMVEAHKTKILSASPFVKFVQPYLLMRAREQERRLAYLKRLRDQDIIEEQVLDEKAKPQRFDLIKPEMVHERVHTASKKVWEVLHAVHDAEYDKALHTYQTQSRQWETYISGSIDLFDPFAHQNIAVLYSLVCTATTVPCSGPDILAFDFYNEDESEVDLEADCTLGQYVEDLCLGATTVCTANGCERKMFEHHRQYVHGEAQLSVFVEPYPCKLRGLQDTILMWSVCRKCDNETQVIPMSESTWKYSFAKYMEISFWSSDLRARADVCPHDIHRDHLRYFGFKDNALRIHYDAITLVEIIVPRARITWKVDNDLRFKNDLFTKIENRLNKFMLSVKARIKSINTESVLPEKAEACRNEVEKLSKRASEEHLALIQKLRDRYMNSMHYEVIPLNRAIRAVQEKAAEWDNAFADFDKNFFPSEKDIRRLATLQLKKIFLDRDDSVESLESTDEGLNPELPDPELLEKTSLENTPALSPQTRRMSPEKAHDMLTAVVEKQGSVEGDQTQPQGEELPGVAVIESESIPDPLQQVEREEVRHLDLAVPSSRPDHVGDDQRAPESMTRQPKGDVGDGLQSCAANSLQSSRTSTATSGDSSSNLVSTTAISKTSGFSKETGTAQPSAIPRPVDIGQRRLGPSVSPILSRTQSQPTHLRHDKSASSGSIPSITLPHSSTPEPIRTQPDDTAGKAPSPPSDMKEKKLSDRINVGTFKTAGIAAKSMIPRSVNSKRKESKVSNLAKHFEQLSKEFEKERIRERRQRAAKSRQARAYPMAASKPIVQIYRNVHEAVEEKEPSDEYLLSSDHSQDRKGATETVIHMAETTPSQTPGDDRFHVEETTADNTETDDNNMESNIGSDAEGDGNRSDEDRSLLDDIQIPDNLDSVLSPEEAQLDVKLDLPKHEKSSLMKMLTNFWAERSASGWQPLEYPLNATDHIFADSDIIVREDEPSSLIAFALGSEDYQAKLRSIIKSEGSSAGKTDGTRPQTPTLENDEQAKAEESILRPTGKHLKYQFSEGSAKMLCKVFYAEQFDALRRKCGVSERIVESLSRCMKWDSKGGKTKSVFLKTLDDRFVLKSLSPIETQAFLQFAPGYFYVMSRFLFHDMPSVIAKMLGFFQITIKNPATGVDFNWSLLIMENLFYDRSPARTFDLKGSMRNRRIQSTGEQNEVLLDENMVDFIYATPLFSREHSKRLLRASVYNDTLFLAKQNVMDYSLMVAVDEDRKELVVGIIDCIRTYTWDKKLETWIKDRGKNRPTVTSPKEYKSRFREAMSRYVLQAPNCWHQFNAQLVDVRPQRVDEQGDDKEVQVDGL